MYELPTILKWAFDMIQTRLSLLPDGSNALIRLIHLQNDISPMVGRDGQDEHCHLIL
jgi:hypothetical protein